MKHNTKMIMIGIVIIVLFILAVGRAGYHETHYYRTATVISIENDLIIVEDECKEVWSFEGDGYSMGDKVKMLMHTNGTNNNVKDDKIINVTDN